MPKFTSMQVISLGVAVVSLVVSAVAQSEDIRSEVEEAVEKALDGRDSKLAKPPAKT